jgi:hypothetical protein
MDRNLIATVKEHVKPFKHNVKKIIIIIIKKKGKRKRISSWVTKIKCPQTSMCLGEF